MNCFRHTTILHSGTWGLFFIESKTKCSRRPNIFHLRIVIFFLQWQDESFQTACHSIFRLTQIDNGSRSSTRWIFSGAAQKYYSWGSLFWIQKFHTMNYLWRTTYFNLGIAFHTRIVPGAQKNLNIPLEDRFSKMNCSRHSTYISLEDRFSKMKCSRRTNIFHLRIVFNWKDVSGAQRISIWGSLFYVSFSMCTTYFHLRIVFPRDELFQAHRNIPLIDPRIAYQSSTICSSDATFSTCGSLFLRDELFQANTTIFLVRVVHLRVELFLSPG